MNLKFAFKRIVNGLYLLFLLLFAAACSSDEVEPGDPDAEVPKQMPEVPGNPVSQGDRLPLLEINTGFVVIPNDPKVDADFTIWIDGAANYEGKIAIELRGSSSQTFPKKSYGFETRDGNNMDLDVSLLGFPEEEDWVLHGPFSDKSLVRNTLIYDLSREINHYASRTKFVDVIINGSYNGVYVLMERIKRDVNRVDIATLKETDNSGEELTGGYIVKVDRSSSGDFNSLNSFESDYGSELDDTTATVYYVYHYPSDDDITAEQRNYISSYIKDFEDALASDNFSNPVTGYQPFIDLDSFIDFFLLNELSNNVDGYRLSTYMHKDKNDVLKMGPIWDFNLAFGNADYCGGGETNVWAYTFNERCKGDSLQVPFWWTRLMQDPTFVAGVKARWSELRGTAFSEANIQSKIDAYIETLDETGASEANFATWTIFGEYIWPNNFIGQNYEEETGYLRSWISDRLVWMDASISQL